MGDIRSVIDWLIDGARSAEHPEELPDQLCRAAGRGRHPALASRHVRLHPASRPDRPGFRLAGWSEAAHLLGQVRRHRDRGVPAQPGAGGVREPQAVAAASRRRRLPRTIFLCCTSSAPRGATDYAAFPLLFLDGSVHIVTFTTQQPGGFTPEEFACIEAVITPLTRAAEIRALKRTATNLLDTYVGRQAGERIMAGEIRARTTSRTSAPRSGCPTCAASP